MAEATKGKEKQLDRTVRHLGTFKNFRGKELAGYLAWHDDGETTRGFKLLCAETHREFKPGLLIMRVEQLAVDRVKFELSGETAPLKAAAKLKKGDRVELSAGGFGEIVKINAAKKSADVKLEDGGEEQAVDLADLALAPAKEA